jgi:hypothetical protein
VGRVPEKEYTLTYENRPGYLYAAIRGKKDSLKTTLGAMAELSAECSKRKAAKILIEHDVPGRLTIAEMFKIGERIPELFHGIIVAVVVPQPTEPDHPAFSEMVALNRGATGRLCKTVAEAHEWLTSV